MTKELLLGLTAACLLTAQEPNPARHFDQANAAGGDQAPIYKVNVVAHTTKAVNYGHRGKPTRIDFEGTVFLPEAEGKAWIKSKKGAVEIKATLKNLRPPHRFGRQYLTYVLWAITPEGRAENLGEILTNRKNKGKLQTATELQTFALIVTAEPYFAVTQPSDVVVMENVVRADTLGRTQIVDAKYELLKRGNYTLNLSEAKSREQSTSSEKVSMKEYEALLELYQARNAVQLAEAEGAADYASDSFQKAQRKLEQAETHYRHRPKSKTVVILAREATQTAEDARIITLRRKDKEKQKGANLEYGPIADGSR